MMERGAERRRGRTEEGQLACGQRRPDGEHLHALVLVERTAGSHVCETKQRGSDSYRQEAQEFGSGDPEALRRARRRHSWRGRLDRRALDIGHEASPVESLPGRPPSLPTGTHGVPGPGVKGRPAARSPSLATLTKSNPSSIPGVSR